MGNSKKTEAQTDLQQQEWRADEAARDTICAPDRGLWKRQLPEVLCTPRTFSVRVVSPLMTT